MSFSSLIILSQGPLRLVEGPVVFEVDLSSVQTRELSCANLAVNALHLLEKKEV